IYCLNRSLGDSFELLLHRDRYLIIMIPTHILSEVKQAYSQFIKKYPSISPRYRCETVDILLKSYNIVLLDLELHSLLPLLDEEYSPTYLDRMNKMLPNGGFRKGGIRGQIKEFGTRMGQYFVKANTAESNPNSNYPWTNYSHVSQISYIKTYGYHSYWRKSNDRTVTVTETEPFIIITTA
ncbi:hypothetical protein GWI33_012705, partial [Rhynchophorus ferrugineus]